MQEMEEEEGNGNKTVHFGHRSCFNDLSRTLSDVLLQLRSSKTYSEQPSYSSTLPSPSTTSSVQRKRAAFDVKDDAARRTRAMSSRST